MNFLDIVEDSSPNKEDDLNLEECWLKYFCKKCRKIVKDTKSIRKWKKRLRACIECNEHVVSWNIKSLANYYKLRDSEIWW